MTKAQVFAIVEADSYLEPILHSALSTIVPKDGLTLINSISQLPAPDHPFLQIRPYEALDFDHLLSNPRTSLASAYVIRKALIRKHYLWQTISSWWVKHPRDKTLRGHVPLTVNFELDYAEFLDEALLECWELKESFDKPEREWWVLKPGMSDQGQGIRLFSSEDELREIFEEWETEESSEDEDGVETPVTIDDANLTGAGAMTSQLRHFVAQKYIERPLLFNEHDLRKFHIRSYVLAVGSLKVYVYRDMLALFAPRPFTAPESGGDIVIDPQAHLTNTCLQSGKPMAGSVHRFWDLPSSATIAPGADKPILQEDWKASVFDQVKAGTSTIFEAAAREQMIHFQTLPNAFEVFGVDWLVDEAGTAWLLEVNAFPDFRQSGEELQDLVGGFCESTLRIAIGRFFGIRPCNDFSGREGMVPVLDIELGRS